MDGNHGGAGGQYGNQQGPHQGKGKGGRKGRGGRGGGGVYRGNNQVGVITAVTIIELYRMMCYPYAEVVQYFEVFGMYCCVVFVDSTIDGMM